MKVPFVIFAYPGSLSEKNKNTCQKDPDKNT